MNNGKHKVNPIPEGFRSVTPALVVRDAAAAIDFYSRAFGAVERCRMHGPGGQGVIHAEIQIGDSIICLGDEAPHMGYRAPSSEGGISASLHLYVADADAAFAKALDAGATVSMPLANMFWGDRYGKVTDPFGHVWGIATHIEDLSPEEMAERGEACFAEMAGQPA